MRLLKPSVMRRRARSEQRDAAFGRGIGAIAVRNQRKLKTELPADGEVFDRSARIGFCLSVDLCYQCLAERRASTDIGPLRLSLVPHLPLEAGMPALSRAPMKLGQGAPI